MIVWLRTVVVPITRCEVTGGYLDLPGVTDVGRTFEEDP